jgi:hypothetical protein
MANLNEFADLVQIACETRFAAGKVVLTVDGMLAPELAALQLAGALKALATPEMYFPAEARLPKHRRKPTTMIKQA